MTETERDTYKAQIEQALITLKSIQPHIGKLDLEFGEGLALASRVDRTINMLEA